jgi:hypothetical protein
MATDYILFVHGVKTRDKSEFQRTTTSFTNRIKASISDKKQVIQAIPLFWGDLNIPAQQNLLKGFESSPNWKDFWMRDFRSQQILEFVGDAALYISRYVGAQVAQRLKTQALEGLKNIKTGDRLHLVTHSWGTVILFDLLFASRWEDDRLDNIDPDVRKSVQNMRAALFGLPPTPQNGVPIASIHTMGSPIALFNMVNVNGASSHDLTPKLKDFVKNLHDLQNKRVCWRNYAHPGDPIAYPLEGVIPMLLDDYAKYVDIDDVMVGGNNFPANVFQPLSQTIVPILMGGDFHGSYWTSDAVAKTIGQVIQAISP